MRFICHNLPFLNQTAGTSGLSHTKPRSLKIESTTHKPRTRSFLHFGNSKVLITTHSPTFFFPYFTHSIINSSQVTFNSLTICTPLYVFSLIFLMWDFHRVENAACFCVWWSWIVIFWLIFFFSCVTHRIDI